MVGRGILVLLVLLLAGPARAASGGKLIALTFDDGPRPQVLHAAGIPGGPPGLLQVLERNHAKATFFVMGWRLRPAIYAESDKTRHGPTCRATARDLAARGHEIENHTYSHMLFPIAARLRGENWIVSDVDRASAMIQAVTGNRPRFVRPPGWRISAALRRRLEARGYRIMTLSPLAPPLLRDVNAEDYLCAGPRPSACPPPSLPDSLLRKIQERERRGVFAHILVFHELPVSVAALEVLLPALRAHGYSFVRLDEYVRIVRGAETGPPAGLHSVAAGQGLMKPPGKRPPFRLGNVRLTRP